MRETVTIPRWFLAANAAAWMITVVCWAIVILT